MNFLPHNLSLYRTSLKVDESNMNKLVRDAVAKSIPDDMKSSVMSHFEKSDMHRAGKLSRRELFMFLASIQKTGRKLREWYNLASSGSAPGVDHESVIRDLEFKLASQKSRLDVTIEELKADKAALELRIVSLEEGQSSPAGVDDPTLERLKGEKASIQKDLDACMKEKVSLAAQHVKDKETTGKLYQDLAEESDTTIADLREETEKLKGELTAATAGGDNAALVTKLRKELADKEKAIEAMKRTTKGLRTTSEGHVAEIERLRVRVSSLQSGLETKQQEFEDLKTEGAAKLAKCEEKLETFNRQGDSTSEQDLKNAVRDLAICQEKLKKSAEEVDDQKETIAQYQSDLAAMDAPPVSQPDPTPAAPGLLSRINPFARGSVPETVDDATAPDDTATTDSLFSQDDNGVAVDGLNGPTAPRVAVSDPPSSLRVDTSAPPTRTPSPKASPKASASSVATFVIQVGVIFDNIKKWTNLQKLNNRGEPHGNRKPGKSRDDMDAALWNKYGKGVTHIGGEEIDRTSVPASMQDLGIGIYNGLETTGDDEQDILVLRSIFDRTGIKITVGGKVIDFAETNAWKQMKACVDDPEFATFLLNWDKTGKASRPDSDTGRSDTEWDESPYVDMARLFLFVVNEVGFKVSGSSTILMKSERIAMSAFELSDLFMWM